MTAAETRLRARILALLSLAALAWVATAAAAPVLAAGGSPLAALLARSLFSGICHQIPDRSFWIEGAPMALCARCTGIYAGVALACAGLAIRLARGRRFPPLPGNVRMMVAAAIPTLIDVAGERTGLWPASAMVRALTGAILAAPLAPLLAAAARELPAEVGAEAGRLARRIRRIHAGTC